MLDKRTLADIVAHVRFNGWTFVVGDMGEGFSLQVRFTAPDNQTHELHQSWAGRKWYVSTHATRAEVVQTCLKAVLTALEHEAREQFTYRNVAIFQPHLDLDALVARAGSRSYRTDVSGNAITGP